MPLPPSARPFPRAFACVGALSCALLQACLPAPEAKLREAGGTQATQAASVPGGVAVQEPLLVSAPGTVVAEASAVAASPTAFLVLQPSVQGSGAAIAVQQLAALIDQVTTLPVTVATDTSSLSIPTGTCVFSIGATPTSASVVSSAEQSALPTEGFIVRKGVVNGAPVYAAVGSGDLGTQYATYTLLELLGFGFFHPFESYIPGALSLPDPVNVSANPRLWWRGMHAHTMHPIELMDSFLVPSDEHLTEAKKYVDWLVANRQNYFQFVMQDTIDLDAWIPHATAFVNYAHQRGIQVGIDTPYQFKQQNGWVLVPVMTPNWQDELAHRLDTILQVPFDTINVELGASEFIPADDTTTMDMLNYSANYLDGKYGNELISKVHVSSGQTAPNYGDINFNFLPGLANPLVGVLPHTVQFYDLYGPAPTYDRSDFSDIREFLLDEIGERTVLYYPETAYWCSVDVDIPMFLPQYIYARWNDLHNLSGSGMDGQVNFTSGFEWNYWMNDWATAAFAWNADGTWQDQLKRFTRIFGTASTQIQTLLEDITKEQYQDLVIGNLMAYVVGWDGADDLGDLVGTHAQPPRISFREVRDMDEAGLTQFESETLIPLIALDQRYQGFVATIDAQASVIPTPALRWYQELQRSIHVTSLRVTQMRKLYEGTVTKTRGRLGVDPQGQAEAQALFGEALSIRAQGEALIAAQEAAYRLPKERLGRLRENPTSYEYGYLYTVSDAYFWRRDNLKAIDDNVCPCMGNLNDMISNLLGEGTVIASLLEAFPTLPNDCFDQCIHPIDRIEDLGGNQ